MKSSKILTLITCSNFTVPLHRILPGSVTGLPVSITVRRGTAVLMNGFAIPLWSIRWKTVPYPPAVWRRGTAACRICGCCAKLRCSIRVMQKSKPNCAKQLKLRSISPMIIHTPKTCVNIAARCWKVPNKFQKKVAAV